MKAKQKNMSRFLAFSLSALLPLLSLTACGGRNAEKTGGTSAKTSAASETSAETVDPEKTSAESSASESKETENSSASSASSKESDTDKTSGQTKAEAAKEAKADTKNAKLVMLYSSLKEDQLSALKKAFTAAHPEVQMDYYAAGTGKVLTKIATEHQSGQVAADLLWVGDPSNYLNFKDKGMLEAYESPEAAVISEKFKDKDHLYCGARLVVMGMAYNTATVEEKDAPKNWSDLTKETFQNQLVMSDPAEAGTTLYAVAGLVNKKEYGWEFFEKLKANGMELESGTSSTINKVGAAAYKACIAVDYVTHTLEKQGSPIRFVYPEKDLIAVSSPIAIMKNSPNPEGAKLLYDFILSEAGQKVLAENQATPIRPGVAAADGALDAKEISERALEVNDRDLAENKQKILERFDSYFR